MFFKIGVLKTFANFTGKILYWSQVAGLNSIHDGPFRGLLTDGGVQKGLLPKICQTYPTKIKLGTVMPYLRKIQKIYKSRDTPPEFC